jgi:hypothetical protein
MKLPGTAGATMRERSMDGVITSFALMH